MLQLVFLPSAGVPDKLSVITEGSAKLRTTLHGLKQPKAVQLSMPGSVEPRQRLLDDLESSYANDVLGVSNGEEECALDEKLRQEAEELGETSTVHEDTAVSRNSVTSDTPRRSVSIGSRASRSTGLTSNFSDVSKDPRKTSLQGKPRGSLSFRDYDAFLSRGHTNGDRKSLSFSPPTTPSRSSLSLTLAGPDLEDSPKRHFRRLRGLSMLRLRRPSSSSPASAERCPHCPQDASSQRRAIHKLPCGHRLCTQALRNTIKASTSSNTGAVPSCCGNPIPGWIVEQVITPEEQRALFDRLEQWDEAISVSTSTRSEARESVRHQPGLVAEDSRTVSAVSINTCPSLQSQQHELQKAMDLPEYKSLCQQQEAQRNRFDFWAARAQASLETYYTRTEAELRERHEQALKDLSDQHTADVSDAEDKQVKAEADMRTVHTQEVRDNATALKHMEAYCAGTYSTTGEPHNRTVTEQERIELEKTQRIRDGMTTKHDSAINVLRGEQGRRMRMRVQRQEKEVRQLEERQKGEKQEAERDWSNRMADWERLVVEKRARLVKRWNMQNTIFLKKLEADTGVPLRIPGVQWQADEKRTPLPTRGLGYAALCDTRPRTDSRLMLA